MMNHECSCHKEHLVSTLNGAITHCGCGIYHVYIDPITLHLTTSQFDAAARLFKLAMGISVGRRLAVDGAFVAEGVQSSL
ncbi:MAG: hypothetical protein ACE5J1_03135 [Nitrospiria bacterium]